MRQDIKEMLDYLIKYIDMLHNKKAKEDAKDECKCSNCVFTGDGQRYCYDCKKYTTAPTSAELEQDMMTRKGRME